MSTEEVVTEGLARFLWFVPMLLVWIVGFTMAIRRLKRNRLPAILTMIAIGTLILSTFVLLFVQMALFHSFNSGRIGHEVLTWSSTVIRVVYMGFNVVGWILIIAAIFVRRPPDAPRTEPSDPGGNPFMASEPHSP